MQVPTTTRGAAGSPVFKVKICVIYNVRIM